MDKSKTIPACGNILHFQSYIQILQTCLNLDNDISSTILRENMRSDRTYFQHLGRAERRTGVTNSARTKRHGTVLSPNVRLLAETWSQ